MAKSEFFHAFLSMNMRNSSQVKILLNLPSDVRVQLINFIEVATLAETNGEIQDVVEKLTNSIEYDEPKIIDAFEALMFLAKTWEFEIKDVHDIVDDLIELKLIEKTKKNEYFSFFDKFKLELSKNRKTNLEKKYSNALLPSFIGIETLVDLRCVYTYSYGDVRISSLNEYNPKLVSVVPIAVVQITRDTGDPKTFEFQCTKSDLQKIKNMLLALEKDIDLAEEKLCSLDNQ